MLKYMILIAQNICFVKREGAVDPSTVTRWFKKFHLGCSQARSGRPKAVNSKAMLQDIKANMVSNTWRISGKLSISMSSEVCHLHDLSKSNLNSQIVPHVTKILQNLWLTLVFWTDQSYIK